MGDDKKPAGAENQRGEPAYLTKFLEICSTAKRVAIFTHAGPDPDAISSMMGLGWILSKKFGIESSAFYKGTFSHPQNVAMVNLLDPTLRPVTEYKEEEFDLRVCVDTVPANCGLPDDTKVDFDICIDHHRETPNGGFNGLFINLKAGSCAATIYHLLKLCGLKFEDENDADKRVVTALLVGISTDTESLMSDDATKYEFDGWADLFEFREPTILKKIVHFERPKFWIDHKASAVKNARIDEGLGIVGLGIIPARHRDMLADMADEMVSWEAVNTAIVFAVVDGDRIEGSVRSRDSKVIVPTLCKSLGGKHGVGGGKLGKGAYRYTMGGVSFDDDDDPETCEKTWHVLNEKETKRILRTVRQ